jgi:hypothetical protein
MTTNRLRILSAALLLLFATAGHADSEASAAVDESSRTAAAEHMDWDDDPTWPDGDSRHDGHDRHGNDVVSIGHDSFLSKGQTAHSVVSILGSSTNEGETRQVVSFLGNTRTTGTVSHDAVAVLGDTFVDGKVEGNAIAIGGGIELGPHAEIDGKVVSVLGSIRRDPAAIVHGGVNSILGGDIGGMSWLQTWVHHCLFYLRPLAPVAGLGWAWALALGFLAFYACLALLFRATVDDCVRTFETQPG